MHFLEEETRGCGELTKERLSHINGLREIWNEPKRSSPLSLHRSEDETTGSVAESAKSIGSDLLGCDLEMPQLTEPARGKAALSDAIPLMEVLRATQDSLLGKIVNAREGYIHVLKLAEIIADSVIGANQEGDVPATLF